MRESTSRLLAKETNVEQQYLRAKKVDRYIHQQVVTMAPSINDVGIRNPVNGLGSVLVGSS